MNNKETTIINDEIRSKNGFEIERGKTRFIVSVLFPKDKTVTMGQLLQRAAENLCEWGK